MIMTSKQNSFINAIMKAVEKKANIKKKKLKKNK